MKTALAILIALLLTGNSFAQQKEQPARYQIVTGKAPVLDIMVLVDTSTGKTWKLSGTTWVPMDRLETAEQVKTFTAQQAQENQKREQMRKDTGSR
jgi:hypothetical protein